MKPLKLTSRLLLLTALVGAACGGSDREEPITSSEAPAMTMAITEPARGTLLGEERVVVVRGVVHAENAAGLAVTVAGQSVEVAPDGTFATEVPAELGFTLIETVARDGSGNELRDHRAVMAGTARPHGETIDEAVVTHIGQDSLDRIARVAQGYLLREGVAEKMVGLSPLVEVGETCLGVFVKVEDFDMDSLELRMTPREGGLRVTADIRGISANLVATTEVLCKQEKYEIPLYTEQATMDSDFRIGLLDDGRVDFALEDVDADVDGTLVDVSDLNDLVAAGLESAIDKAVSKAIAEVITAKIEEDVEPMLRQVETEPFVTEAMGLKFAVDLKAKELAFDENGGRFRGSLSVKFPDNPGADVIYSPGTLSIEDLRGRQGGLQIGLADDVVDNFLSVLWSTGALDYVVPLEDSETAKLLNLDRLEFYPLLPPVVQTINGAVARLSVGDFMVKIIDEADNVVAEAVVSGSVGLAARVGGQGQMLLEAVDPDLWVGFVGPNGESTNSARLSSSLADSVLEHVTPVLNDGLSALPRFKVRNVAVVEPELEATSGYLVVGAKFAFDADGPADEEEEDRVEEEEPEPEPSSGTFGCATGSSRSPAGGGVMLFLVAGALALSRRRRS